MELMRKDMVELKRNLNDEVREKELFSKINDELRGTIKKNEGEKTELNRDLCDHRQRCSSKCGVINASLQSFDFYQRIE